MTGPKVFTSPYETQRNFKTIVYVASGSGLALLALLAVWLFRRKHHSGVGTA